MVGKLASSSLLYQMLQECPANDIQKVLIILPRWIIEKIIIINSFAITEVYLNKPALMGSDQSCFAELRQCIFLSDRPPCVCLQRTPWHSI